MWRVCKEAARGRGREKALKARKGGEGGRLKTDLRDKGRWGKIGTQEIGALGRR